MPHKADRDGAAARFVREARAAASIQSEHVVRVFEVSTLPNGASYIVMEHLIGADLGQLLASRGRLPIAEAVDHLLEACEALGEAHGRGIVHRDLKPQNLFVTSRNDGSPCVKVLDFGISKAADDDAPNLTATNTIMGTPRYMSPEQVRSLKEVDHRSDLWALGVVLFELVAGAPPFDAQTSTALCAMIAMDPPTPLRQRCIDAPAELEAVILRCLQKDPGWRFQDVAALAEALAPFASERGRCSAMRVSRVVRGDRPAGATTYPPGAALGYAQPTTAQGTTQQGWQPTGAATVTGAPARRGSSALGTAMLGLVAGVVLHSLLAGGGWLAYSHRAAAVESASAPGAPAAAPPTPVASVGSSGPAAVTSTIAGGVKKPGGGAASAAAPKGVVAPVAPSAEKPKVDEELEAQKRLAQSQCSTMQILLRSNDPKKNDQARQVKSQTCLRASGAQGASCERAVCRSACNLLHDQACLSQLDSGERNFPARF
jgi:serine/threonine-protein kinase